MRKSPATSKRGLAGQLEQQRSSRLAKSSSPHTSHPTPVNAQRSPHSSVPPGSIGTPQQKAPVAQPGDGAEMDHWDQLLAKTPSEAPPGPCVLEELVRDAHKRKEITTTVRNIVQNRLAMDQASEEEVAEALSIVLANLNTSGPVPEPPYRRAGTIDSEGIRFTPSVMNSGNSPSSQPKRNSPPMLRKFNAQRAPGSSVGTATASQVQNSVMKPRAQYQDCSAPMMAQLRSAERRLRRARRSEVARSECSAFSTSTSMSAERSVGSTSQSMGCTSMHSSV